MPSLFRQIGIILLLTCLGASYSLFSGLAPRPWAEPEFRAGEIRVEDARVLDVVWVDARSEADYESGHITGAILLNEDGWDDGIFRLMGEWLDNPRPIVVYCESASCGTSKRVAERLRDALPQAEIYSLQGGWDIWQEQ
jgi:rhodanese-related sulfurtransferase